MSLECCVEAPHYLSYEFQEFKEHSVITTLNKLAMFLVLPSIIGVLL